MPNAINALDHPICLAPLERRAPSAWIEHTPFAMWLTAVHRPRILVELGTHFGTSYCSFCQAIDALGLPTRSFAIDTWEGDPHSGEYTRDVLDDLRRHHDPRYFRFSTLLQSTFDEAQSRFADGEIDLLHIDGYHTYEAARHDFETWRPKVSDRGIVLFHDIEEREGDFGVWRLWEELTSEHRGFRFLHEHGLGVLALGEDLPDEVSALLDLRDEEAERFRTFFHEVGRRLRLQLELERAVADRDFYRAERETFSEERVGIVADRDALRADRDAVVAERDALRADRDALALKRDALRADRDAVAAERDALRADRDAVAADRDALRADRDALRADRDALALKRDALRADRDAVAAERDLARAGWERVVATLGATEGELAAARGEWEELLASQSWRAFRRVYRLASRIGPDGSRRRLALKQLARAVEVIGHPGEIG